MKLSRYILLSFTLIILSTLLVVSLSNSISIQKNFDTYLLEDQMDKVEGLKELLKNVFLSSSDLTGNLSLLEDYLKRNRIALKLYQTDGKLLYESNFTGRNGQGMMHRMTAEFTQEQIEIKTNNVVVAYAQVGYYGDYSQSIQALNFVRDQKRTLWLSGLASLIVGLILSIYLSRKINRPILAVSRVTQAISQGALQSRTNTQTPILELKALSADVDQMAGQLEAQEALRRNLMLTMGHEIKTPLTIIKHQIEGYLDQVLEPTPANLHSTQEEILRLQLLVENIEQLSALEVEQVVLKLEKTCLKDEVEKSIAAFKERFNQSKLTVELIGSGPCLNTDKLKIRQIIDNLLINAIKYATPETAVTIQLSETTGHIELTMENDAPTLTEDEQKQLCDIHFRTHRTEGKEGRGIGLYVTKALVLQLKGQLRIVSADNHFRVSIQLPKVIS